ncbi:MAG: hypothetical protein HC831_04470 [Chloroflexia bacterium]|nr:hypothetical protein [Chloroflexia bacterium]
MKENNLNIDKYFEIARSAPIVITKDEVMKIIGNMVSAPPISFGQTIVKFKNVIIMTTTTIATIVTAFVYFGNNSANTLAPITPQTSNNELFIIDDEEEDSLKIEDLTITQDSNKVFAGSVINYNEIIINEEPEDDIFEDNLIAEEHDESVNFIIPKRTVSDNDVDSSFLTEIYTKSVGNDTIKYDKNTKSKQFNSEYDYKDGATTQLSEEII